MKNLLKLITILLYLSFLVFANETNDKLNVLSYNIQVGSDYLADTPNIVDTLLQEWNIDILATQELHIQQTEDIDEVLENYSWFGVGRDDGEESGEMGTIFYNTTKLDLLEEETFWLSETPDVPGSESWNTACTRIVTWGKFQVISSGNIFYLLNTHFDHSSSWAREESAQLVKEVIDEEMGFYPIILTGDFNCSDGSTPYETLTALDDNVLNLYDSKLISQTDTFGPEGTYSNRSTTNPSWRIDFIFTNTLVNVNQYGVINELYNGDYLSDHFPVFTELELNLPDAPEMPTLSAYAGDGQVTLSWDKVSEDSTYESSILNKNDFQGYKLYRSRDPEMSDAVLIEGYWDVPLMRSPLMVCDKMDDIYGYTNYGIIDGFGYYLGEDSGLQHYYVDDDIENNTTYYYVLTAYDCGIDSILDGYAPMENEFTIETDGNDDLISCSQNVAVVTPQTYNDNETLPGIMLDTSYSTIGNLDYSIAVFYPDEAIEDKEYKIKFLVDTLDENCMSYEKYRHENDILYTNNGFEIWSVDDDSLIYREDQTEFTAENIVYDQLDDIYHFNTEETVTSEVFEGLQFSLNSNSIYGEYSAAKSGWITGDANIVINPSSTQSVYFPWEYEIVFTDGSYEGVVNKTNSIYNSDGDIIGPAALILGHSFNFYVENRSFLQEDSTYEKLDLIVYDTNMNDTLDYDVDEILVGYYVTVGNQILWAGTVFTIDFSNIENESDFPKAGDRYKVDFDRPFLDTDEIYFTVDPEGGNVAVTEEEILAEDFQLKQNYPNPFNNNTKIEFCLPQQSKVMLTVYNILGQKVSELVNETMSSGQHIINFNINDLSSGVYFYTLKAGNNIATKKMLYLK